MLRLFFTEWNFFGQFQRHFAKFFQLLKFALFVICFINFFYFRVRTCAKCYLLPDVVFRFEGFFISNRGAGLETILSKQPIIRECFIFRKYLVNFLGIFLVY